jgi:outer membrane protein
LSVREIESFRENFASSFCRRGRIRSVLLLCLAAGAASAEPLPLWEAGAGIGTAYLSHYRGANQYRNWVLPVPYIVYRGKTLRVDDRRLHGLPFNTDRVELDLSISGSPPVRNNDARAGMPDLDATLELGPSLDFFLYRSPDRRQLLEFRLPARKAIASDFSHVSNVGWIVQPNLNLDMHDLLGEPGVNLGLQVGILYADRGYNRYFYSVDPAYATPGRPAFSVGGGYAGTTWVAALSKRYPGFWVGAFAKWDSVSGAVFADSPLVKSTNNFTSGIAIAWILRASDAKVEAAR